MVKRTTIVRQLIGLCILAIFAVLVLRYLADRRATSPPEPTAEAKLCEFVVALAIKARGLESSYIGATPVDMARGLNSVMAAQDAEAKARFAIGPASNTYDLDERVKDSASAAFEVAATITVGTGSKTITGYCVTSKAGAYLLSYPYKSP